MKPFGQVGNIYSRDHEGTGLELPLAKSHLRLHGANLKISSEYGKGSRASAQFPPSRTVAVKFTVGAAAAGAKLTPLPRGQGFAAGDIEPADNDEAGAGKGPGIR